MMAPTHMRSEIGEQPAAVADTLDALRGPAEALSAALRARSVDRVVLIARGSSDHAAVYGRYLLEGRCGLVTALAAPSLYTTYEAPVDLRGALAIGVSQSGETPEIVSALVYARARGALTAGITNDAGSSLARAVEHPLVTRAGAERSVAATKTFTAQLAAFAALAAALGARELAAGLAAVPERMAADDRAAPRTQPRAPQPRSWRTTPPSASRAGSATPSPSRRRSS